MSSKKRKQDELEESDGAAENDGPDPKHPAGSADNGGPAGPSANDSGNEEDAEKPERKKFRLYGNEHCGTMLICGGTNWDLIGRRELPKGAKGAGGRNLWGPHTLRSLSGIRVRSVVSGNAACHSVVITEDYQCMTWGRNDKGQLGQGDTKRRDNPTVIDSLKGFRAVDAACGRAHTLVLTDDGSVFSFGDNKMGQCGLDHGHVYSFGDNKNGQCGIGSQSPACSSPQKISFKGRPIATVACGAEFSVIVDAKGYLFSFGCPEYGQLGHNTDGRFFVTSNKLAYRCELVPRRVGLFIEKTRDGHVMPIDDVRITGIACGVNHTLVMDAKKRCFTWGFGGYGRLGHSEPKDEMIPRLLKFFDGPNRGVKAVYAGGAYSMAISETGCLYFWGQNKVGGEATMYPKPVHDLSGWNIRLTGCSNRSIVVVADDMVISWGPSPTYGELGYGENKQKSSTTPQEVKPLDGVYIHQVACGFGHTLFVARGDTDEEKAKLEKLPEYAP